MKLIELKNKRAKLVHDARALLDSVEAEGRTLSAEEDTRYDQMLSDVNDLAKQIERQEAQLELERSVAGQAAQDVETGAARGDSESERADKLMAAARSWLRTGQVGEVGAEEFRNLQATTDTEGGYLALPEQMVNQLIKFVDDEVFIRRMATVIPVPRAVSLGVPTLETDMDDADWTTELATGSEDSSMAFGKRKLEPHPMAKRIKISRELLRVAMLSPEMLVMQRMAYKFGITQEKAYLTGNGAGQPLGLFTASAQGISTDRDISTDNNATSMTFDGLMNAFYGVKAQYQRSGEWLFHRDGIKQISKLKDGQGQYLWQPSVTQGTPDMIKGRPVNSSEYVPNTFTTGQYVGMFGDFSNYWIADAYDLEVQRLDQLYAESNQIGFIGRLAADGMPVLEEAFSRITLG